MKVSDHSPTKTSRWQAYKQLELIPDSSPNLFENSPAALLGSSWLWRKLLSLLIYELVDQEQQTEYLERCWAVKGFEQDDLPHASTLQKLWVLMN